ncbi:hypothetical protein [Pandoraea commovens]|uniref:Uncharacterized protein n=1 Tax=Pandoraea commovens TaxID=2508289 RepID=A0ABY5QRH4_9BURK|nr:hypothetical protein [Pandoraea commovens]UVA82328.1 hypothetical protein NTU39_05360 [Pandoraea commovens]
MSLDLIFAQTIGLSSGLSLLTSHAAARSSAYEASNAGALER